MSQGTANVPTGGTMSATTFAGLLNTALNAFLSEHSGTARPANGPGATAVTYQEWMDETSATLVKKKKYDGVNDVRMGTLDKVNSIWIPKQGGGLGTVASASTVDLGALPHTFVTITGTTTVNNFGSTPENGEWKFVYAGGAFTLTNSASMICPGGVNVTLAAGDFFVAIYDGSGVWIIGSIQRASGALSGSTGTFSGALAAGAISGTTGTFSGAVSGTTGTFSGAVSGTTGTFSGALAAVAAAFSGAFSAAHTFKLTGVISPTTLAGNTDDWAPTNLAISSRIRASASAAFNLTGLTGGTDGRIIILDNAGSFNITLKNNVTSTAANRFQLSRDYILKPNTSIVLIYDGTSSRWRATGLEQPTQPTRQVLTSGTGATYTTPAGATRIEIRMVGGGGGGGAAVTNVGATGTASSFNAIAANPGAGGGTSSGVGGAGGAAGAGAATVRLPGSYGGNPSNIGGGGATFGGIGAPGMYGAGAGRAGGAGGGAGIAGSTNTGAGGGGAGSTGAGSGGGGGGGEYVEFSINNPATSYTYTVGAGGAGGAAGSFAGGAGASGLIIVDEYYD